jgi:hypothetical protein
MPHTQYTSKDGGGFVSCEKINGTSPATGGSSSSKSSNVTKIVGGVLGGVGFIILLLLLIAFLARRHRKEIEKRRQTITHPISGPMETMESDHLHFADTHQRQGSSSIFQPFGGAYHSPLPAHTRQRSIYRDPDQQWI